MIDARVEAAALHRRRALDKAACQDTESECSAKEQCRIAASEAFDVAGHVLYVLAFEIAGKLLKLLSGRVGILRGVVSQRILFR